MQRHAVHGRGHGVFAHPVMNITALEVTGRHRLGIGRLCVDRTGQVGGATDHFRDKTGQHRQRLARGLAGGPAGGFGGNRLFVIVEDVLPTLGQIALDQALEFLFLAAFLQAPFPVSADGGAAPADLAPGA